MEAEAASTPLPVPLPPPHRQLVTLSTLDARGASKAKKRQRDGVEPDGAAIVARDRMLFAAPELNAAVASSRPRRASMEKTRAAMRESLARDGPGPPGKGFSCSPPTALCNRIDRQQIKARPARPAHVP